VRLKVVGSVGLTKNVKAALMLSHELTVLGSVWLVVFNWSKARKFVTLI
jgi:hypothetical protein